jgi:probable rRNA maturation factor
MRKPARYSARRPKTRRGTVHRRARAPAIDIIVASVRWKAQRNAKALIKRAIAAAASAAATTGGEVAIVLTDDAAIRALNRDWRQNNAATNVLSFPATVNGRGPGTRPPRTDRTPHLLGDIVIAYETTEREARAERKPFAHHLAHLAVHGFLHLVGYDHLADDEAEAMEGLETRILDRLGVPDPYVAR